MFRQEKRLNPFRIKPLSFKTWHILPCFVRYMVEVAGVEPASANTTLENTTCLDIVYYFNTLRPDEQGSKCDPLSLV